VWVFSGCYLNACVKRFWLLGRLFLAKARNVQEGAPLFPCTNGLMTVKPVTPTYSSELSLSN